MKRLLLISIIVSLLVLNLKSQVVNIPDANFKAAINNRLGQPTDYNPTVADLNGITGTFTANSSNISSIEGAQYLTGLTGLYLKSNQINNISALSGLTNLTELELYNNQLIDISAVSGLWNLRSLFMIANDIIDISAVSGLTNLTTLELTFNDIIDISSVSGLTTLTSLRLGGNDIIDISPVSGLTNLTKLNLPYNDITDISSVSGLANLTSLDLRFNQLVDISPVTGLTNLRTLLLENNQIIDISSLSGLTNLTSLRLVDNQIVDISAISGLSNLIFLLLSSNQITDIYPLLENIGFSTGDFLWLESNPLSKEAINVHIPILQSRGFNTLLYNTTPNNYAACYPMPNRYEIGVSSNTNLEWRGNLPSREVASYDVWLGNSINNLVNIGNGVAINDTVYSFSPTLNTDTDYWWKVRTMTTTDTLWSGLWHFDTYLTADFTAETTTIVAGNTIQFNDLSIGTPTSWQWDFENDGIVDFTTQNPSWTYDEPGLYTVSLIVGDGSTYDTLIKTDYIDVRVNIPDANFKAAINYHLGQPADYNPNVADLNGITVSFIANSANISSIEGAQYLTNLTRLYLNDNQIIDISSVSGLTNLTFLKLDNNQLNDISPVLGLTNLSTLSLVNNQLNDISPVSGLTNLTELLLQSNQLIDISSVSGLTNLINLSLDNNQIIDISSVSGLTNLTYLYLNNNQLIDISAISGLTKLIYLYLSYNQIIDISSVSGLTNLSLLDLKNNQITDIYPLVENIGFGTGERLFLDPNPLSKEAINVHIPDLQSRGFIILTFPTAPNNFAACYPLPNRYETGASSNTNLEWQGNFSLNEATEYEVWLGESSDNLINVGDGVAINDTVYSFTPTLNTETDYWWKVKTMTTTDTLWSGLWNFATNIMADLTVQNKTIIDGQANCYNATSTITVAGSETTIDIQSGGEATFIAGETIYLKPGFHSHSGSTTHAYITTTGDYCGSQQSMVASAESVVGELMTNPKIYVDEPGINIYPNPTTGQFTIDFLGNETSADIRLLDFQGVQLYHSNYKNQMKVNLDIGYLNSGMYIIVIKTEKEIIIKKIIKNY